MANKRKDELPAFNFPKELKKDQCPMKTRMNVQRPTLNVQRPMEEQRDEWSIKEKMNVQRPTLNVQLKSKETNGQ